MSEVHPSPDVLVSEPDKTEEVDASPAPTKVDDEQEVTAGIEAVTLAEGEETKQEKEIEDVAPTEKTPSEETPSEESAPSGEMADEGADEAGQEAEPLKAEVPAPSPVVKTSVVDARKKSTAFTAMLDEDSLAFFNEVAAKPFSQQAVEFLNAYWEEIGDQAEFIFSVAWETMTYADQHATGCNYLHLYDEGNDLDFNIGLYFYEKLCKRVLDDDDGAKWRDDPKYAISMPSMMTAITRKKLLREKVDANFDGRVSFLEYLLFQYQEHANPADFTQRAMKVMDIEEHPEIIKARAALDAVNLCLRQFETEKKRLEDLAELPGVKGLAAKQTLAIFMNATLAQELSTSLIHTEAAVRMANRKFSPHGLVHAQIKGESGGVDVAPKPQRPSQGSMWWMNRELEMKKQLYGRKTKSK